jgi:hypothetical protein
MLRTFTIVGSRVFVMLAIVAVTSMWSSRSTKAQSDSWTPSYPMILTPERAMAFVQAADQKLDYIPGEVLVKFKPGVTTAGQQRALTALRSRPSPDQLQWISDTTALLRDSREWNATILAAQLAGEPEVEYAEPNALDHITSVPTDPGYAARQWNFGALDLPRAWDINSGATNDIIVAVLDTGVNAVTQGFTFPTWNDRARRAGCVRGIGRLQ